MANVGIPGILGGAPQDAAAINYGDPSVLADIASQQQQLQQRQALAQSLMSQQMVPGSGKAGVIGSALSGLIGGFIQKQNDGKVSDLLAKQFAAQNAAAKAAKNAQIEDEYRKMQNTITENAAKADAEGKSKLQYALPTFTEGGTFDPKTNTYTPSQGYANQQIGIKTAEANAQAAATASHAGAGDNAKLSMISRLMAQPDSPTKTAQLTSLLGEGGMQAMQFSANGAGAAGGPSGDDYLKTLNPNIANQVKAISEGRQAPPSGMAMRSPMGQQLLAAVSQYDPTFDATNYAARSKTRNDFTAGKSAQTLNSLNTAIGHAGELYDVADKLGNTSFPAVNSALNWASVQTGDPRVTAYNQTRDALVGELTKAFRGSSGNKADIEEATKNLSAAGSPDQQKAAIGQAMKLLSSKATSLQDQYQQAFGPNSQPNFLDPHAQAALKKLTAAGIDTGFQLPDAAPQAAPQGPPSAPQGAASGTPSPADILAELQRRSGG